MWVWQDWDAPCRCVSLGFAGCKRWFSWTLVSWMMAWFVLHQRGRLSRTWEEQIIWSKESESFCLHRLMSLMSMRLIPQYVVKWELCATWCDDCQVMLPQEIEVWNCFLFICPSPFSPTRQQMILFTDVYWHMCQSTTWKTKTWNSSALAGVRGTQQEATPGGRPWRGGSEAKIGILFRRIGSNTKCPIFQAAILGGKFTFKNKQAS